MHHLWFVSVLIPEPGRTHALWPTDTLRDVGCWLCGVVESLLMYLVTKIRNVLTQAVFVLVPLVSSSFLGRNIQKDVKNW